MRSRGRHVWIPFAISLLLGSAVHATSISVTGNPGANGAGVDGGPGADAAATAISGDRTNVAVATGGRGGDGAGASGGAGGDASARAETSVAVPARAAGFAIGGGGGAATGPLETPGRGGDATAQAHASGVGGSEARAIATGGRGGLRGYQASESDGGDAVLIDAVSGSDPIALTLEQRATGGRSGSGIVGAAYGDAVSTGDFENPAGGDLLVLLFADGGDAHIGGSATSTGAGDASLEAYAFAWEALVVDPLLAHATGSGDASVSLEAREFGDGANLSLMNWVNAVSDGGGAIAMRQSVEADAESQSILDVTRSATLLDLEANARAGISAAILVRGRNDAGDVRLGGTADSGIFATNPVVTVAEFEAQTSGDGHDIEIGSASRPARARGSASDDPLPGGDAEALATAVALGNSAVHVEIEARGGYGDDFLGGNAMARAHGSGGGTEAVGVIATAVGGNAEYGVGGDALAEATAEGLGPVAARALAHGGPSGGAFALAHANGASGTAEAVSSTHRLFRDMNEEDGPVQVGLAASVAGATAVAASGALRAFGAGPVDPVDGFIRSAQQADASLLAAALAGNPRAASAHAPVRRDDVFALVELQLGSGGGLVRTFTADIAIGDGFGDAFDPPPEGVLISFLDPEIDVAAFGSLTLRSWDEREPSDIYEVSFADALDALAFLDDGQLAFGVFPRTRHLEISFETTGVEGAFFLDFLIATVPEPSALVLLALALGLGRVIAAARP